MAKANLSNTRTLLNADCITWHCDVCGRPVTGIGGYIHVSHVDIANYQDATVQLEARAVIDGPKPIAECLDQLLSGPFVAAWRVHHVDCDPNPGENDYWLGIDKIATYRGLAYWTAHLMEKQWLAATNWDDVLRRAVSR